MVFSFYEKNERDMMIEVSFFIFYVILLIYNFVFIYVIEVLNFGGGLF